ncbi:MAG: hypothetical protein IKQ81_08185 [Clostridiales bacterium]|nr:hypothetical protein [Clostridiales bacterium]
MEMEVLSLVIESVLAILALIIAVIQLIGESRDRREEKKEKANREKEKVAIGAILRNAQEAAKLSDKITSFSDTMSELSKSTGNDPSRVIPMFDKMIEDYEANFFQIKPYLEDLYKKLVENEEMFPMAYGYGKYIQELRDILNIEYLRRARRNGGYDAARIRVHHLLVKCFKEQGGKLDPETALEIGHNTEHMIRALEPYYRQAETIKAILFELNTKYETRNGIMPESVIKYEQ